MFVCVSVCISWCVFVCRLYKELTHGTHIFAHTHLFIKRYCVHLRYVNTAETHTHFFVASEAPLLSPCPYFFFMSEAVLHERLHRVIGGRKSDSVQMLCATPWNVQFDGYH
jgi:hypothetical protein